MKTPYLSFLLSCKADLVADTLKIIEEAQAIENSTSSKAAKKQKQSSLSS